MFCPSTLVVSVAATAAALTEGRSNDEVAMMTAVLFQLAHDMETVLVARQTSCGRGDGKNASQSDSMNGVAGENVPNNTGIPELGIQGLY